MKITILGKGAFGSVMGSYLSKKGHKVIFNEIKDSEIIFICTTSNLIESSLKKLKDKIKKQSFVVCSKGFAGKGHFISEVIKKNFKNNIFFLSGPTLAKELEKEVPSAMVLAGGKGKEKIKKEIESKKLKIELSDDQIGVEVSSSLKNSMAILIGIAQGAGYGQNTSALIFTKALNEIKNIGIKIGAKPETFLELSCAGDLFLISRNRTLGVELGKGKKLSRIIKEMKHTPAGIFDIKNAMPMIRRFKIKAPLMQSLYKIIFENASIKGTIDRIISI